MTPRRVGRLHVGDGLALALVLGPALIVAAASAPSDSAGRRPHGSPSLSPSVGPSPSAAGPGVVSGRVSISPVTIALDVRHQVEKRRQVIEVLATVGNVGPVLLDRLDVVLQASPGGLSVRPGEQQIIRRLASGASETVSWQACGHSPGNYLVTASVTAGDAAVMSPTRSLVVTAETVC